MRLHKKIALLLGYVGFCFITSCNNFLSPVGSNLLGSPSEDDWSGNTETLTYDGTQVQFELSKGVRILNIQANQPVDVFMAKMNFSSQVLSAYSTRYIVSTDRFVGENQFSLNSSENSSYKNLPFDLNSLKDVSGITTSGIIRKDFALARDFVPPVLNQNGAASRSAGEVFPLQSVAEESQKAVKNWQKDDTKALWIDVPKNRGTGIIDSSSDGLYTQRRATLRAIGQNCYVWVVSGDGSRLTISETQADNLVKKFDYMYSAIREVFGSESDNIFHLSGGQEIIVPISDVSDTETKVNIVVYDIGGDYKVGQQSGVVGYFWPKDYYSKAIDTTKMNSTSALAIALTNEGKYFYVDSGFLQEYESIVYSTLAHEFQHMVNFGEKTMSSMANATMSSSVLNCSTWFTEMLSMVCEDMVQQYLDIKNEDSSIGRLVTFAQNYYGSGLTDWLNGNYVIWSYAGAYAFGAYLARNYGGTELIKEIATNAAVDQEAITQALNVLGINENFESVFEKYVQALVLDNPPSDKVPSFNKSVKGIGGDMKAINLFEDFIEYENGKKYPLRPKLLGFNENSRVALRPYGFSLHRVGSTDSTGPLSLTFSRQVNDNERVYILVQPSKQ